MNSSKLADYSEIISSIAILATLVFLSLQMQQNTQAIEASTSIGVLDGETNFLNQLIAQPDLYILITKPEITDEEAVQLFFTLALAYRNHEIFWDQYNRGAISDDTWIEYETSFTQILSYPSTRNWWNNFGEITASPSFRARVNTALERMPVKTSSSGYTIKSYFVSPDKFADLRPKVAN